MTSRAKKFTWAVVAVVFLVLTAMAVNAGSDIEVKTNRSGLTLDEALAASQGK
jgi:hypothetical protein